MEKEANKKKNIALYLRVSTEEQANEGYGIDVQLEKLKAFVTLHNYALHKDNIYTDQGFSGTLPIEERPGLQRLFNDAEAGKFQKVLVYKVDRLARDNFIVIGCVRRFNELGINFCSATEPFDTSNTFGNFMVQFLGATAEMDRRNILERTQNGRIMAAKAGKWVMGTPPYGYNLAGGKKRVEVKINEKQAKWVKQFYEWLVYEGCSTRQITIRANDLKIPTKFQEENSKRKGRGVWWPRTISRLLTNQMYTGTFYLRKYRQGRRDLKTLTNESYLRDEKDWIAFEAPQIISKELYEKALKQLKKNSEFAKRNKKKSYLFSGLLHCSKCGFKLRGQYHKPTSKTATGSKSYYGYISKDRRKWSKRCDYCGAVTETRVMSIWNSLQTILTHPDLVYKKLKKYTGPKRSDHLSSKMVLQVKRLISLKSEKERINKAFLEIGSIDEHEYKTRLKENEKAQEEILQEKRRLEDIIISEKERNERVDLIGNLYKKLKKSLDDPSYETMEKIIHRFVKRVELNFDTETAKVEFNFPFDGDAKIFQDNPCDGCPAKTFSLYTEIPIISTKETRKVNFTIMSKNYKGLPVSPMNSPSIDKTANINPVGVLDNKVGQSQ